MDWRQNSDTMHPCLVPRKTRDKKQPRVTDSYITHPLVAPTKNHNDFHFLPNATTTTVKQQQQHTTKQQELDTTSQPR
jgi:hypothetical protein